MEIERWLAEEHLDRIADHYSAAFVAMSWGRIVKLASRTTELDIPGLIRTVTTPDLTKKVPRSGERGWFRFELPSTPPRVVRVYGAWVNMAFFVGVVVNGDGPELPLPDQDYGDLTLAQEFLDAACEVLSWRPKKTSIAFPPNDTGSAPGGSGAEAFAGSVWPPKKPGVS